MSDDTLNALLSRVEDAALRDDLKAQIADLRGRQKFGLVFEEHLPETVRLPSCVVRRGSLVQLLNDDTAPLWTAGRVHPDTKVELWRNVDGVRVEAVEAAANLVVVRTFGQPLYPGLKPVNSIRQGGDKPSHMVINGENHHVLEALAYTHTGKVDVIYIDPPYNTGGDFTYNDKRVAKDDRFRHSKWLSFMNRRLRLAKALLKPTGVIIVAIDDNEHAHLKLLMDQVFGGANFISNVVWQGGRKNDSRYVSNGADYMLVYSRDEAALRDISARWREEKPGVKAALEAAELIWSKFGAENHPEAQAAWRTWMRDFKRRADVTDAVSRYTSLDEITGEPIFTGQNISWPGGGGPRYDVLHPITGQPVLVPRGGWRYKPEDMQRLIAERRVRFGSDETSGVQGVTYLREMSEWVAGSVFDVDRRSAPAHLRDVLGEKRFDFPKDHTVLMRWIDLVTQSNPRAVVLDFFAGSGSTTEAVMRLNEADGGRRQSIVVTNNEVEPKVAKTLTMEGLHDGDPGWEAEGIFEKVARPRIETIVTGIRQDGSSYSDGLAENVEFLELTYEDRNDIARGKAFAQVAYLLWAKSGACGGVIDTPTTTFAAPACSRYAILFDVAAWRALQAHLAGRPDVQTVFVVTDSPATYRQVTAGLGAGVTTHMLYENYLTNFEINTGGVA